jgi:hypothetical protein
MKGQLYCPRHGIITGPAPECPGSYAGQVFQCPECGMTLLPRDYPPMDSLLSEQLGPTEHECPPTRPFGDGTYYVHWAVDGETRWTFARVRNRNIIEFLGVGPSHDDPTARYIIIGPDERAAILASL